MLHFICAICAIFFLFSCNKIEKEIQFISKREIKCKIGFEPSVTKLYIYYDKTNKKEYLYFVDRGDHKHLKIFDLNGKMTDSIPLKPIYNEIGLLGAVSIISLDTIIITSFNTNKIAFINRKGICWRKLDLNYLATDENKNYYLFHNSASSDEIIDNNMLLSTVWAYNITDSANAPSQNDRIKYWEHYMDNRINNYYLASLKDIYSEKPKLQFGLKSFHKNMGDKSNFFVESSRHIQSNGKIILVSDYDDNVFVINAKTLIIEKKKQISSKYTKVGTQLITNKELDKNTEILNIRVRTSGYISCIYFDKIKCVYYLKVYHQIPENTPKQQQGNHKRPFSIIVTDTTFKKLGEYQFDYKKYDGLVFAVTSEGILLLKKNKIKPNPKKIKDEIYTFEMFEFKM